MKRYNPFRQFVFVTYTIVLLLGLTLYNQTMASLPRNSPTPGGIAIIALSQNIDEKPKVSFRGKTAVVNWSNHQWVAYIALPLSLPPDQYQAKVSTSSGTYHIPFDVSTKNYPEQRIKIKNKRLVNPNTKDMKRIRAEKALIAKVRKTWDDEPVDFNFQAPVIAPLSSKFGLRRYFNDQPRAPHSGLDFAAAAHTPVYATAPGIVVHTGDFFFNGKSVFIHHGQGVISFYCHLNDIDVKKNDVVDIQSVIGKVGSTGRATGPHLHWGIYFSGIAVDPELFLAQTP